VELDKLLKEQKSTLEALGPQRVSSTEQASYLIKIASDFQTKTAMALDGAYYTDDNFDEKEALRLANAIVTRNEQFGQDFHSYGHTYEFKQALLKKDFGKEHRFTEGFGTDDFDDVNFSSTGWKPTEHDKGESTMKNKKSTRKVKQDMSVLEDVIDEAIPLKRPIEQGLSSWLSQLYHRSRGFEIGTFDPKLLANAMKESSTKWRDICRGYVSDVIVLTHEYLLELLTILCPDERVLDQLLNLLTDKIMDGYKNALDQVDFILLVERSTKPATQNHYFNDSLQKW
jgi:hypothetical protein